MATSSAASRVPQGASTAPTRARYVTVVFAMTLAVIMYIDRVCISQAAPLISKDLGLTKIQMGWAFSIFGWAYALFEIPGGWLADRMGPRRVLMRIVIWWSFFTAATGWAWSAMSLLVTRALFGVGEAGCFPNLTRIFTLWLPHRERERAQANLWLAARWGGALTPLLVAYVLDFVTWRRAFEMFGLLGVGWAIVFYRWFRDDPRTHPSVNAAEAALLPPAAETAVVHGPTPWGLIYSKPAVWLLAAQYTCLAYGWWFYVTWLPTYLREVRGTSNKMGALLAGLPLLLGGVGCLISAAIIPRLTRALGSVALARRIVAIIGFAGASASIFVFTKIDDPTTAMFVLGMAGLFNDFVMPAAWAGCMDVGGRYAGTVSGTMNMMGSVAGALSPLVIGYLLAWTGQNWTLTFYVSAAVYCLGGVCWLFLDAHTPIEQPALI
ncbi:MAG: MFS transporter [Acidobacteriota bacterium]|nr:MFS transporter [Acidobacteriota bacterium]